MANPGRVHRGGALGNRGRHMRVERRPCTGSESSVHPSRGGLQNGSLIHGLLDRLRYCVDSGMVADHKGMRMSGAEFAGVVYRAAAGLRSRGLHPEDVVAVLAPVSTARLVSVCTALAVGAWPSPCSRPQTLTFSSRCWSTRMPG